MFGLFCFVLAVLASPFKSKSRLEAENAVLRHQLIVLGEAHLRRILTKYAAYYNDWRTHRSLNKDAPMHRAIQRVGGIVSTPVLGGLHHRYVRV